MIIRYHGYPVEIHHVTTQDGYIIQMHRIPFGKTGSTNSSRDIVFLQHGLLGTSSNWVANLPHLAMGSKFSLYVFQREFFVGYILADAGFDVWMGNSRGNHFSIGHTKLNTNDHEFWEFSFDEMAQYDLEAAINYSLKVGNKSSLYYVGHSQGTSIMFAKLSKDPTMADKVRILFALGPVSIASHITGFLRHLAVNYFKGTEHFMEAMGKNQFLPESGTVHKYQRMYCKDRAIDYLCEHLIFLIVGHNTQQINMSRLEVFLSDMPGGTSTQNILHWIQMVHSGQHQMYDWESEEKNMQKYGQKTPPLYNISLITTDMYLWWSPADFLADQQDIRNYLLRNLPPKYVKGNYKLSNFNHLDFIWGNRAAKEIYRPIVEIIQKDQLSRTDETRISFITRKNRISPAYIFCMIGILFQIYS